MIYINARSYIFLKFHDFFVSSLTPGKNPEKNSCGGGGGVNSVKKGIFLRIFSGDRDSVSSVSQFPYDNATFEPYSPKLSLQNIENYASDSKSSEAPRKKDVLRCTS